MWGTDAFRQDGPDAITFGRYSEKIPLEDRPFTSEHQFFAWEDARVMNPLTKPLWWMGSLNIVNREGQGIIEEAQRSLAAGQRTFVVTPANEPDWTEFLGSSLGGSRFHFLVDRAQDMGNIVPRRAFVYADASKGANPSSKDYHVMWQVGPAEAGPVSVKNRVLVMVRMLT